MGFSWAHVLLAHCLPAPIIPCLPPHLRVKNLGACVQSAAPGKTTFKDAQGRTCEAFEPSMEGDGNQSMLKLEDIKKNAAVSGIEPGQVVRIVTTELVGDSALTT